jgi:hypothetical protein
MNAGGSISTARIGRTRRRLAGNRNLGLRPFHFRGVITLFDWAKVEEGVLFLGLDRKPRRPALLSAQAHLDLMVRANRDRRFDALPAEDDIENPVHVRLQFGNSQLDGADNRIGPSNSLSSVGRSIREKQG